MEINFSKKALVKYQKDLDKYYDYYIKARDSKPKQFSVSRDTFSKLKQTVSSDTITYRGIPVVCH